MAVDFKPNQNDYENLTPFKSWLLLQINTWGQNNFPFVESDFDELTNYGMMQKLMKALNDVISNENLVEEDMTNLFNAFTEIQNYINNYFDNLNVQNEIDNKLDEMVEDGTITNLIKEYVDPIYESYEESINLQINNMNRKVDAIYSNSPRPVASVSDMTDTSKIYVNTTDGKWYYYDSINQSWVAGGTYQSTGILNDSVTTNKLNTQIINKLTNIGYEFNNHFMHEGTGTFEFNYSDTSIHNYILTEDDYTPSLSAGTYIIMYNIRVNEISENGHIRFRAGLRYNGSNQGSHDPIVDAHYYYDETPSYKKGWGRFTFDSQVTGVRPLVIFVNAGATNPISGNFTCSNVWLFKVNDDVTNDDVQKIVDRIEYYAEQESFPILNISPDDKENLLGELRDDLESDIQDVKDYVDDKLQYIPDYLQEKVDFITEHLQSTERSLQFIFQTDHHTNNLDYHYKPVINAIRSSNLLMKNLPLALNVYGGDYVGNGASTTKALYEKYTRTIIKEMEPFDFNIMLKGNHDINQLQEDDNEKLTDLEVFNLIGKKYIINNKKVVTNNNIDTPMYGYIDFDFQKIRLVFVNTSDGYDQNLKIGMGNINTTQLQWLADNAFTLPSNKSDYQTIVIGHYPLVSFTDGTDTESGRLKGLYELLKAFKLGSNLSYTAWGNNYRVVKDFRNQGAKTLICYLCGHTHYDADITTSDGILQIATTNAGYYGKENDGGTINELAYDIVSINPLIRTLWFTRVGAGVDRTFNY